MTMRITQGTAARRTWEASSDTGQPITWVGWSARAQARLTSDSTDVLFEWSTADNTIELVPTLVDPDTAAMLEPAQLRLLTPAVESAGWLTGDFVFDVAVIDPNGEVVARIPQDKLVVTAAVTR